MAAITNQDLEAEARAILREQLDCLSWFRTELINLGVSRAAVSLREMIGEQVHLSVPSVDLVTHQQAIDILGKHGAKSLVVIHEVFEGDFESRALLIFPEVQ